MAVGESRDCFAGGQESPGTCRMGVIRAWAIALLDADGLAAAMKLQISWNMAVYPFNAIEALLKKSKLKPML